MRLAHHTIGGASIVAVVGELDRATAGKLARALDSAATNRDGRVIVDLTDASFIDSTGIRALIDGSDVACRFAVVVPPRTHLHRSLVACGAHHVFPLVETRGAGVASVLA